MLCKNLKLHLHRQDAQNGKDTENLNIFCTAAKETETTTLFTVIILLLMDITNIQHGTVIADWNNILTKNVYISNII